MCSDPPPQRPAARRPAFKNPSRHNPDPRFYTRFRRHGGDWICGPRRWSSKPFCEEFRKDYNRHHFVSQRRIRWRATSSIPQPAGVCFGVPGAEAARRILRFPALQELKARRIKEKKPFVAECFAHIGPAMKRDHAASSTKSMGDFGLRRPGFLTPN